MLWDLVKAISITTFIVWKNNIGKGGARGGGLKIFLKGGNYLKIKGINTLCELCFLTDIVLLELNLSLVIQGQLETVKKLPP